MGNKSWTLGNNWVRERVLKIVNYCLKHVHAWWGSHDKYDFFIPLTWSGFFSRLSAKSQSRNSEIHDTITSTGGNAINVCTICLRSLLWKVIQEAVSSELSWSRCRYRIAQRGCVSAGGWTGRAECSSSELNITGAHSLSLSLSVRRSLFRSPFLCLFLYPSPSQSRLWGVEIFSPKVHRPQSHGHSLQKRIGLSLKFHF